MVIRINCLRELLTEILYITLFLEDFFFKFHVCFCYILVKRFHGILK